MENVAQMLKGSLILRLAITDFPFSYKKAIKNAYSSFIFNKDFANILPSLINKRIINIGKETINLSICKVIKINLNI